MTDTAFTTLNTPRLFSNAIRRARRLAVRSGTRSPIDVKELNGDPCSTNSKRARNNSDENEPKRQCVQPSQIFDVSKIIQFPNATAEVKNTASARSYGKDGQTQNLNLPSMAISPPQIFGNSIQSTYTANPGMRSAELLRTLLASLTSQSTQPTLVLTQLGHCSGHASSAFFQGAAWAAAVCQQPLLLSTPVQPLLIPASQWPGRDCPKRRPT